MELPCPQFLHLAAGAGARMVVNIVPLVAIACAALSCPSFAQSSNDVPRIGFLSPASGPGPNHAAYLRRLRALGFEEGKTIEIIWKFLDQKYQLLPDAAVELTRLNIKAISTQTQAAAIAAQKATSQIPIVFVGVRDPIVAGLVKSIARPEGNITGATLTPSWELAAKQVEILKELVPQANSVAILWNPDVVIQATAIDEIVKRTAHLKVTYRRLGVQRDGDIEQAFESLKKNRVDGVITLVESFTYERRDLISKLAIQQRIPTIFEARDYVDAGGLLSYGIRYHEMFEQGATYIAQILKGARPSDLPVVEASKFDIVLNMRTAKALGLSVPRSVLVRATEVIE